MHKRAISLILALISLDTEAQNLTDKIGFDDSVRTGTLASGFTYYIRKNETPSSEISMHLVVKAGIENEDQEQLEIAHLLEHMAFAETTHFPDPYKYFQAKGLEIGREINARTQLDATSFQLHHLPARDTTLIFDCLRFLRDCADGITLPRNKVIHESGTVLRELYLKDSYTSRAEAQYMSKVTGDGRYDVSTIERKEMKLKSPDYDALSRFYHTWYRPGRQGIIIAGDIDVEHMEHLVRQIFDNLKKMVPEPQAKSVERHIEWTRDNPQFLTVAGLNLKEPILIIYMKHRYEVPETKSDYKNIVIGQLYNKMMERRLYALVRQENSPLSNFSHIFRDRYYVLGPDFTLLSSKVFIKPNRIKDAFTSFFTELERVRRYGFANAELKNAKEELIQAETVREARSSDEIVAGLEDHFVYQMPFPSNENRKKLVLQLIKSITTVDVNRTAQSWIQFDNADIVLLVPKHLTEDLPTENAVREWLGQITRAELKPKVDFIDIRPLMNENEISSLQPKKNIQRNEFEQIGVTHLLFPNGVHVYLKPGMDVSKHDVYVSAFSHGGASVYSGADHLLAMRAAKVVAKSGLGLLSPSEVTKYALFKGVSLTPHINENCEKLFGRAKAGNIENLFQMIYMLFTQPGKDSSYLSEHLKQLTGNKNETTAFTEATIQAAAIVSQPDPDSYINKFTFDRMYRIFRERFGNAADFAFVISGDFQTDQIVTLLAKYMANLPSTRSREKIRPKQPLPRKSRLVKTFHESGEHKNAHVKIIYPIAQEYIATGDSKLQTLAQILQIVLTQKLRRDNGGTYYVAVQFLRPTDRMPTLAIDFECAPDNANHMIQETRRSIQKIRYRGPDAAILKMAVQIEQHKIEKSFKNPLFWARYLAIQLQYGQPLEEIMTRKLFLEGLTSQDIKKLAQTYLKKRHAMQFIQLPAGLSRAPEEKQPAFMH